MSSETVCNLASNAQLIREPDVKELTVGIPSDLSRVALCVCVLVLLLAGQVAADRIEAKKEVRGYAESVVSRTKGAERVLQVDLAVLVDFGGDGHNVTVLRDGVIRHELVGVAALRDVTGLPFGEPVSSVDQLADVVKTRSIEGELEQALGLRGKWGRGRVEVMVLQSGETVTLKDLRLLHRGEDTRSHNADVFVAIEGQVRKVLDVGRERVGRATVIARCTSTESLDEYTEQTVDDCLHWLFTPRE